MLLVNDQNSGRNVHASVPHGGVRTEESADKSFNIPVRSISIMKVAQSKLKEIGPNDMDMRQYQVTLSLFPPYLYLCDFVGFGTINGAASLWLLWLIPLTLFYYNCQINVQKRCVCTGGVSCVRV